METPIKPNFFIIGAPKSGTTALSEYLRAHPQVFFSEPKEVQYFAEDFKGRFITTEKDYLKLFRESNPHKHLAIGEGSAIYLFSDVAVPKILEFQPDAKFIVMLRNPVNLVQSFHLEMLDGGLENIVSFVADWNLENQRRLGKHISKFCLDEKYLFYSDWGRLGTQLQRALSVIPKERLKIILFDDFVQDTAAVYRDTLMFLGLPDDGRMNFPKVNEKRYTRYVFLSCLVGVVFLWWMPVRIKLGLHGWGLSELIKKINSSRPNLKTSDTEVRAMLHGFYADEIALLEELIKRDLSSWK